MRSRLVSLSRDRDRATETDSNPTVGADDFCASDPFPSIFVKKTEIGWVLDSHSRHSLIDIGLEISINFQKAKNRREDSPVGGYARGRFFDRNLIETQRDSVSLVD